MSDDLDDVPIGALERVLHEHDVLTDVRRALPEFDFEGARAQLGQLYLPTLVDLSRSATGRFKVQLGSALRKLCALPLRAAAGRPRLLGRAVPGCRLPLLQRPCDKGAVA